MTRKRPRKEPESIGQSLSLVPVVQDDSDTIRLADVDFPSFDIIGTESVLGKMGSIMGSFPSPLQAPPSQALVIPLPTTSNSESTLTRVSVNELVLGIGCRCQIETQVENLRLSQIYMCAENFLQTHSFPFTNSMPIESLWESYQSFVNEILFGSFEKGERWGLIEIPRLGSTCDYVYVQQTGGDVELVASVMSDGVLTDRLRKFGVAIQIIVQRDQNSVGDDSDDNEDDDEEEEVERCYVKISGRIDVFGFFDFLRTNLILKLIESAKVGNRSRWPIMTSNCAFRHSCVRSPTVVVRRGIETRRFLEVEGVVCPMKLWERYAREVAPNSCVRVTIKDKELFEVFNRIRVSSMNGVSVVELTSV